MKNSPRINGQLKLPRNGNLVYARTRQDLLSILGYCHSDGAQAGHDGRREEISEVTEVKSAYPKFDSGD